MYKEPVEYLNHILDECNYILSVITPEISKADFVNENFASVIIIKLCY